MPARVVPDTLPDLVRYSEALAISSMKPPSYLIKEYILKTELSYYDVCPKVLLAKHHGTITIQPLGHHAAFAPETPYTITVIPMNETKRNDKAQAYPAYKANSIAGSLSFSHQFGAEGQYALRIVPQVDGMPRGFPLELRVYAVEEDLYRLRPYRGDFHAHSCYSDGKEAPAIVAANYRKAGFDFLSITDHERYEPSIEAATGSHVN